MTLRKVISGGQIGADIAGLRAAHSLGIETGGWATKGWRTKYGSNPALADFGLIEHTSVAYPPRTEANVRDSDVTIRFAYNFNSAGEICTLNAVTKHKKPCIDIPIKGWEIDASYITLAQRINSSGYEIINIAGNASKKIERIVEDFLIRTFRLCLPIDPICLFHGKKLSEHICLYCCLCFDELTPETCAEDENGQKWDICVPCKEVENARRN